MVLKHSFAINMVAKLGERPTILDSHSDKVLKDFIDQKRDEKMYKKSQHEMALRNERPSTAGVSRRDYGTSEIMPIPQQAE